MRLSEHTIPTDFTLFDDTTHDADKFANVRDMRKLRENHNVLLAKRLRRPILHHRFVDDVEFCSGRPLSIGTGLVIWQSIVLLTQLTQKLRLVVRAHKSQMHASSTLSFSPKLYPKLHPLHTLRDIFVNENIEVSAAYNSPTEYSVDFPVPHTYSRDQSYYRGRMAFEFCLYLRCKVDDTYAVANGIGINDQGPNWVEPALSIGVSGPGDTIYTPTDPTHEPRTIIKYLGAVGPAGRYFVDHPWNREYNIGTDTLTVRQAQGIILTDLTLYELPITDFDADAVGAG